MITIIAALSNIKLEFPIIIIPNVFVPHYRLSIVVFVDLIRFKNGIYWQKTQKRAIEVNELTYSHIISNCYGPRAESLSSLNVFREFDFEKEGHKIEITLDVPLTTNIPRLSASLKNSWIDKFGLDFESYISYTRHYTEEEINSGF